MHRSMTERHGVNKPGKSHPRRLAELLHKTLGDVFARQGFASAELVTRWTDIVGIEIAEHSQPERIHWPRPIAGQRPAPGTLVLRVEGPTALEIQHLSGVILERVNRFLGWQAVGALRLRQAPLAGKPATPAPSLDGPAAARIAADLAAITDEKLRDALARLGAAIKQT
jgi:hypothetical protein